jgi:hypothetical protein
MLTRASKSTSSASYGIDIFDEDANSSEDASVSEACSADEEEQDVLPKPKWYNSCEFISTFNYYLSIGDQSRPILFYSEL